MIRPILAALAVLPLFAAPAAAEPPPRAPEAIATVHHTLHGRLARLAQTAGPVGQAARALDKALLPHFRREAAFALPPLALLPALAEGKPTAAMRWAVPLTARLKAERAKLIAEHKALAPRIEALRTAGGQAGNAEAVQLAGEIQLLFKQEEAVYYPAALLVGQQLKGLK